MVEIERARARTGEKSMKELRHIKLIRSDERVTGIVVTYLGLLAVTSIVAVSSLAFVTLLNILIYNWR